MTTAVALPSFTELGQGRNYSYAAQRLAIRRHRCVAGHVAINTTAHSSLDSADTNAHLDAAVRLQVILCMILRYFPTAFLPRLRLYGDRHHSQRQKSFSRKA